MINLTAAWLASHDHLKSFRNHLPLTPDQRHPCPICAANQAHHVRAHLRLGEAIWIEETKILYCPSCENFILEDSELAAISSSLPSSVGLPVTAVNARLWSPMPTFLNVEPTTRCNFRCWYCVGRHMEQKDIKVDDFISILDHAPSIRTIALVGEGEPLMHTGFFDMARMAIERGKKVIIVSNGSTLSTSNVKKLCETGVTYVSISIDSIDPARFAKSRIDGDLEKVLRGIKRLRRFRDENGYKYPKIALKGTLFDYSEHELLNIVELAKEYGAEIFESFQTLNQKTSYLEIYPEEHAGQFAAIGRVAQTIVQDSRRAKNLLKPFEDFAAEEGIEFGGQERPNGLRKNCDERYTYALLSGDITPCCQIKDPIDPNWNLVHHSLDDIYKDRNYENVRFNLWNGLFPSYCEGCGKTR
jgi:MoaA/NifB/PqqE/SkfB family radical SAM enzyme